MIKHNQLIVISDLKLFMLNCPIPKTNHPDWIGLHALIRDYEPAYYETTELHFSREQITRTVCVNILQTALEKPNSIAPSVIRIINEIYRIKHGKGRL